MHLQIEKIRARFPAFSLRSFLPHRLQGGDHLPTSLGGSALNRHDRQGGEDSAASGPIGTTGSVVKIRLPASSSTATPVHDSPAGTVQRTDPTKSVVSVVENSSSMNLATCPAPWIRTNRRGPSCAASNAAPTLLRAACISSGGMASSTARGKSRHGIRPSLHPGISVTYSRAPSSRLVRRAQERSRCSRDFHHGLSRSYINASEPRPGDLSIIFCRWPGTKSQDRVNTIDELISSASEKGSGEGAISLKTMLLCKRPMTTLSP